MVWFLVSNSVIVPYLDPIGNGQSNKQAINQSINPSIDACTHEYVFIFTEIYTHAYACVHVCVNKHTYMRRSVHVCYIICGYTGVLELLCLSLGLA